MDEDVCAFGRGYSDSLDALNNFVHLAGLDILKMFVNVLASLMISLCIVLASLGILNMCFDILASLDILKIVVHCSCQS